MSQNQYEVEATGEIGTVYTTKNGMSEANSDMNEFGWKQVSPTKRIWVRSERDDLPVHGLEYVWKQMKG